MLVSNNATIIEVRGGAGGDEAKIWSRDLLRMYLRYSERQGWKTTLLSDDTLLIKGNGVFDLLKNESGVHRVQRIPTTEKHGRIHTSTATISVLPEVNDSEVKINPSDLTWQFYHSAGHGGQNVQKVATAVRLTHKPTGIVVTCQTERFQEQNRIFALSLLRAKLWEREELERERTVAGYRSSIGRGMRAEKIRTYNFPQNRVTDHRINKSFHNLDSIVNGDLGKIIGSFNQKTTSDKH
jgi:peptide chain release factor 1